MRGTLRRLAGAELEGHPLWKSVAELAGWTALAAAAGAVLGWLATARW